MTNYYIIKTWVNDVYDGWYVTPNGVKVWNTKEEALVWFYALETTLRAELVKIDPCNKEDSETIIERTD